MQQGSFLQHSFVQESYKASLKHVLSKHFQIPLVPSDCGRALTLICQYLQIPLRYAILKLSPCQTKKVTFKRGAALWRISDLVSRFKCFPRSCESREWPLSTPTVLLGQSDGPELGVVVGVGYASLTNEKIIVFMTPTEMVHVTDPLVKSQLLNIWVLASEVMMAAVSWRKEHESQGLWRCRWASLSIMGLGSYDKLPLRRSSSFKNFQYLYLDAQNVSRGGDLSWCSNAGM